MSIWNKVLLGLIIVASLGLLYLGMRTLKTHQYWRELAKAYEVKAKQTRDDSEKLLSNADPAAPGLQQYRALVGSLVVDRGRVWSNVEPQNFNAQTGQGTIITDQPNPNGIAPKALLYIFEEKEANGSGEGGRYLGEFEVEGVADNQVQVKPFGGLGPEQLKRLAQASKPWIVYETMPLDRYDMFAGLSMEELQQRLPSASVPAYLRHGQPATWDKIAEWGVEGWLEDDNGGLLLDEKGQPIPSAQGKFSRSLRDYNAIFRRRHEERVGLNDSFAAMQEDIARTKWSLEETKQQIASRKRQIEELNTALASVERERRAVADHASALTRKTEALRAKISELMGTNKTLAQQITRIEIEAAQLIDARTRAMAQIEEPRE